MKNWAFIKIIQKLEKNLKFPVEIPKWHLTGDNYDMYAIDFTNRKCIEWYFYDDKTTDVKFYIDNRERVSIR